jgi:hypothetical protein
MIVVASYRRWARAAKVASDLNGIVECAYSLRRRNRRWEVVRLRKAA